NVNECVIFAAANGLVMRNRFAMADACQKLALLIRPVRRYYERDTPAGGFARSVAKNALGPLVPTGDYSLEGFAYDGVFGGGNDGGQSGLGFLGPFALDELAQLIAKAPEQQEEILVRFADTPAETFDDAQHFLSQFERKTTSPVQS